MRISFDLDDTLIFKTVEGPVDDSLPPLQRSYLEEKLRAGTRELMLALAQRGHEIWIYSNSYRGKSELLRWFQACGLPVTDIVNQQMHEMKRSELGPQISGPIKFPPWKFDGARYLRSQFRPLHLVHLLVHDIGYGKSASLKPAQ